MLKARSLSVDSYSLHQLNTKLKREVAIKILPDEFSRDPHRLSWFQALDTTKRVAPVPRFPTTTVTPGGTAPLVDSTQDVCGRNLCNGIDVEDQYKARNQEGRISHVASPYRE